MEGASAGHADHKINEDREAFGRVGP